ncbi:hypothetical protein GUITHDRAFT_114360 [Guillardia theta CCMP2712]|uniref:Uncharacterized protein n=1 Tax=Guillardia theta (strain CCMP2712) TaxID=905079 RepID=L1ITR6_GUITC|nr:hypothetical protein GUITHDRAFT_114360 [Guillardia theta CCMP2712]EKX39633.1 hypothetical protein GUITHDRAFT_114360 [Guillardia theta CCMP2712]|eukprot:XP_005826613.1 hypothetical protein GUITHDRAFT_114360 [Guillardia theta CCMP2712]
MRSTPMLLAQTFGQKETESFLRSYKPPVYDQGDDDLDDVFVVSNDEIPSKIEPKDKLKPSQDMQDELENFFKTSVLRQHPDLLNF